MPLQWRILELLVKTIAYFIKRLMFILWACCYCRWAKFSPNYGIFSLEKSSICPYLHFSYLFSSETTIEAESRNRLKLSVAQQSSVARVERERKTQNSKLIWHWKCCSSRRSGSIQLETKLIHVPPVWPDLANILSPLKQIITSLWQFLTLYLVFGKIVNLLC